MSLLQGKQVVLGVTGGIAAYKAATLASLLVQQGAFVDVIMTDSARAFVQPLTFTALTHRPVHTDVFAGWNEHTSGHVTLAAEADLLLVAPATAAALARLALGLADDLLGLVALSTTAPLLAAPAMEHHMWHHPATQQHVRNLQSRGATILPPESGRLGSGASGDGRLAPTETILQAVISLLGSTEILAGRHVIVTAGGTREPIDPVRYIGNRSSGKMGYAIANAAAARGADVVVVSTVRRDAHPRVRVEYVDTAEQMGDATLGASDSADAVVMAAAVADFRPKAAAAAKIKKADGVPEIVLEPTPDILALLGERKRADQFLVGFAAETDDVRANAASKLAAKRVDLMVGNDVRSGDSGFEVDTNRAVLLDAHGGVDEPGLVTKVALADLILDRVRDARRPQEGASA